MGGKIRKIQTSEISRPLLIVIKNNAPSAANAFAEFMKTEGVQIWEREKIKQNMEETDEQI